VAIKVLDAHFARQEDLADRMFGEYEVSRLVRHPGLIQIFAADLAPDGTPYLVMELLDGENLGDLGDRGRIVIGAIAAIGAQVADAVAALHESDVIHCDIKPDNIFALYDPPPVGWPMVKLVDYGVSRRAHDVPRDTIAGTPSCMSPEHWHGSPGAKADVYSLGCSLYWLTTGHPPFHGTLPQLMVAHSNQLADRVSVHRKDAPAELERVIARCLAKDPGMRPTMRDVARDLAVLAAQYITTPTTSHAQLLEAAG
jgi:serine/threonine protein kinase